MYKGRNYYSKLVLKQCYFWLAHHTCLLSGTSTAAHPKPPTSVEKKTRQRNIPLRTMELRRKGEKSLGSYTGAAPAGPPAPRGFPKAAPARPGLLASEAWAPPGAPRACGPLKPVGGRLLFLGNGQGGGRQPGGSTGVLGQVFGFEGSQMVLLGSTTSKIAIRFFLMFCTLIIILLMVDRAFNKIKSIKIKVTSMSRASRDYFKFTPEAYCSTHKNAFPS